MHIISLSSYNHFSNDRMVLLVFLICPLEFLVVLLFSRFHLLTFLHSCFVFILNIVIYLFHVISISAAPFLSLYLEFLLSFPHLFFYCQHMYSRFSRFVSFLNFLSFSCFWSLLPSYCLNNYFVVHFFAVSSHLVVSY